MATIRIPFLRNDAANATNDRFRPISLKNSTYWPLIPSFRSLGRVVVHFCPAPRRRVLVDAVLRRQWDRMAVSEA